MSSGSRCGPGGYGRFSALCTSSLSDAEGLKPRLLSWEMLVLMFCDCHWDSWVRRRGRLPPWALACISNQRELLGVILCKPFKWWFEVVQESQSWLSALHETVWLDHPNRNNWGFICKELIFDHLIYQSVRTQCLICSLRSSHIIGLMFFGWPERVMRSGSVYWNNY